MNNLLEKYQLVERSIQKKYHKELWTPFVRAIKQYQQIRDGDKIAVCISGGKDSMLMAKLFQMLHRHSDFPFELVYLVMDPGYNEVNRQKIESNAALLHMVYYTTVANNGYSGDLEIALIPDSFRKDILKETEDTNGVLIENSTVEPEHFALLFEFSGDKKKIRHCMYYCTAARPTIEGKTNEDSKEVR